MKSKMNAAVSLFLLSFLAAGTLISCGDSAPDVQPGTEGADPAAETVTAEAQAKYHLPEKQDLGGRAFTILAADNRGELFDAEMDGEVVNDAVCRRNDAVEDYYDLTLNYVKKDSDWRVADAFTKSITSAVLANDSSYDVMTGAMVVIPSLGTQGYFCDICSLPIDLENPWWVADLQKTASVNGKLYSVVGNLSNTLISTETVFFFNKQLQEELDLPNFYALVRDGKWTLDAMVSAAKDFTADLNGDGKIEQENDRIAIIGHETPILTFQSGFHIDVFESTDNGIVYNGMTDRLAVCCEKISELYQTKQFIINNFEYEVGAVPFMENRSIFLPCQMRITVTLRDMPGDFGILPFPKFDEAQENYRTDVSQSTVLWCIPVSAAEPELSASVLEVIACESMKTVTPAYFEVALKEKYSRDTDTADMLNIIRDSLCMTFDGYMNYILGDTVMTFKLILIGNQEPASFLASKEPGWTEKLKTIVGE